MSFLFNAAHLDHGQETTPSLPVGNKWSEILSDLGVVNIAEAEPTSTQPNTAHSVGTRSLI